MKRLFRFSIAFVLAAHCSGPAHADNAPALTIAAPKWQKGDWWRVSGQREMVTIRPAAGFGAFKVQGGGPTVLTRYDVLGQETLVYEKQGGTRHAGKKVPPETCWVLRAQMESPKDHTPIDLPIILYFRINDLSLRQMFVPVRGKDAEPFLYSSTAFPIFKPNDVPVIYRGAYRANLFPVTWHAPCFPLKMGASKPNPKEIEKLEKAYLEYFPQTATPTVEQVGGTKKPGLRVSIGNKSQGITIQNWVAGYPWWISAQKEEESKSQLLETNKGPVK